MKKYYQKKHLSLDVNVNEKWVKKNHKEHRTYRNVDDDWKISIEHMDASHKLKLFFKYALEGNKKMLKYLFETDGESFNINAFDKDNNNVLMYAVKSGKVEAVRYLLEIGVNPNYTNIIGLSPFHLAVRKNSFELVASLYDSGADINIVDYEEQSAMFDAVIENNPKMIACLSLNGGIIDAVNFNGETPLMISAHKAKRQEAMLQLIYLGANVNAKDKFGRNAFMHAILCENNPMMDILLKNGTNMEAKDDDGLTALMYCAKTGNREGLRVLIARGANIFTKDNKGKTALDYARKYGFKTCAEILAKAERICRSDLTTLEKRELLREFAKHNKVTNSCAR